MNILLGIKKRTHDKRGAGSEYLHFFKKVIAAISYKVPTLILAFIYITFKIVSRVLILTSLLLILVAASAIAQDTGNDSVIKQDTTSLEHAKNMCPLQDKTYNNHIINGTDTTLSADLETLLWPWDNNDTVWLEKLIESKLISKSNMVDDSVISRLSLLPEHLSQNNHNFNNGKKSDKKKENRIIDAAKARSASASSIAIYRFLLKDQPQIEKILFSNGFTGATAKSGSRLFLRLANNTPAKVICVAVSAYEGILAVQYMIKSANMEDIEDESNESWYRPVLSLSWWAILGAVLASIAYVVLKLKGVLR